MIVDCALYRDGRRCGRTSDLPRVAVAALGDEGLAWIGLHDPTPDELASLGEHFGLPERALQDAGAAHQRAKLERHGDVVSCVLRPGKYVEATSSVDFGEVHVLAGPGWVLTVRHGDAPPLHGLRAALERRPDLIARGGEAVLHAVVDRVLDDYRPVIDGLEQDIDDIEDDVFDGTPNASRRIYDLFREVIDLQRATKPLPAMLERLLDDQDLPEEERDYLRNLEDRANRVQDQADAFRALLQNILSVNLTLETKLLSETANRQGDEVKRISGWAAILFAPTLIASIYGMNFDEMPELGWQLGYPMAIALMVAMAAALYVAFRRRGWM